MTQDQDKARREDLFTQDIQSALREETSEGNSNDGLERFMAGVAASPKGRWSWWKNLNSWLGDIGFSPALGSAVAMVQLGVIAALLATHAPTVQDEPTKNVYRGVASPAQETPDLKITISPDAGFAGLASLLRANNCRIIAGPSELRELWVVVDDKMALVETRRALEQSGLIDDVAANP